MCSTTIRKLALYETVERQLLPLDQVWANKLARTPWPTKQLPEIIGGTTSTLRTFIHGYLFVALFQACAESLASENASRLAAMQRAEKNIEGILGELGGPSPYPSGIYRRRVIRRDLWL